jgi:Domain of unknown function (DUF4062)
MLRGLNLEKRYQVFVSSTYEDLRAERQEVMQALLELDCIPSGMELFPAASEDQWTLIKKVIDDCDYYIVIAGGRYGSTGPDKKSYTQMEYEYAISKNKPVMAFLHADPASIASGKTENTDEGKRRLQEFCELLKKKVVKTWSSPQDLGSVVSRSIVQLIKAHPGIGWIRADKGAEEVAAPELLRLRKQIEDLQGRLQQDQFRAPSGADKLAQGSDKFIVVFNVDYETKSHIYTGTDFPIELEWNEIFKVLSPLMIDRATEDQLEEALEESCRGLVRRAVRQHKSGFDKVNTIRLNSESLRTIIVQFRALGLIGKDTRPRSLRDTETYWSLTPYGDNIMTQLNAIPKLREALGLSDDATVSDTEST